MNCFNPIDQSIFDKCLVYQCKFAFLPFTSRKNVKGSTLKNCFPEVVYRNSEVFSCCS